MNRKLSVMGIVGSFLYLIIIGVWRWSSILCLSEIPLNELGDFFAGVFGPLAILWLVLGFFQQGIELKQNTKALQLQADELKNSVEQQRLLVEATNRETDARIAQIRKEDQRIRESEQPDFKLLKSSMITSNARNREFEFKFVNKGPMSSKLRFSFTPEVVLSNANILEVPVLDTDHGYIIKWIVENDKVPPSLMVKIECIDSKGFDYTWKLHLSTLDNKIYNVDQDYGLE